MRAAFRATHPETPDPAELIEFAPADYFARAKMSDIFEREAPLEIDLGSGEGAFLVAMAAKHPEHNFLGVERLLGRVRKVCRMVVHHKLTNARLLRIETAYALRYVLPHESVTTAHVLFPDPWPKRHHQSRRLIQDGFMEALHGILVPGGELKIKTDDQPYFLWMEKVLERVTPDRWKLHAHHWLILHGRYTCKARKPLCEACIVADLCEWPEKTVPA